MIYAVHEISMATNGVPGRSLGRVPSVRLDQHNPPGAVYLIAIATWNLVTFPTESLGFVREVQTFAIPHLSTCHFRIGGSIEQTFY